MAKAFQEQHVHVKGKQNAQKHLEILKQYRSRPRWELEIFKQQEESIAIPFSFAHKLSGVYLTFDLCSVWVFYIYVNQPPWIFPWQCIDDI